jgi:hypothetical protein
MRLSLLKAAHAIVSSAARQEIRVRSGRDDKERVDSNPSSVAGRYNDRKVTSSPNDIGAWREARCPLKPKEGLNGAPSALMVA